jgi:hypothetical protein
MDKRSPEVRQRDAYEAAQLAYSDWMAAQSQGREHSALMLKTATNEELERLTALLIEDNKAADEARRKFMAANQAYLATLKH